MNQVALRKRIAVLVLVALLSATGATGTTAVVADDAQALRFGPCPPRC
jgi:hypothetical protein